MFKSWRNYTASILVLSLLTMPCMAAQNYTYTTRVQDNYVTEQQQGTVVNNNYYDTYNNVPPQVAMNYSPYYNNGYVPVNQAGVPAGYYNGYAGYETPYAQGGYYPMNASQPYNRNVTVTQSYEDTRENVDKNISRAGSIATIVGGLALVGAITTAIIKK